MPTNENADKPCKLAYEQWTLLLNKFRPMLYNENHFGYRGLITSQALSNS
jgi:hypothetical protein